MFGWFRRWMIESEQNQARMKEEEARQLEELKKQCEYENEHGHPLRELGKFEFYGHTYFLVDIKRDFVYQGIVPDTEFLIHDPDCKKCQRKGIEV